MLTAVVAASSVLLFALAIAAHMLGMRSAALWLGWVATVAMVAASIIANSSEVA